MNLIGDQKINNNFKSYIKECPDVKTTIHWYDLYGGHYIRLNKEFQKELFKKAVNKAGDYSELGRILNVNRKTISNCSKGITKPQITVLKKIANYINYPLENINNKIIKISGLKPKLPFELHNKEGAEIRAAFLSDGHIDKNPIKPSQYCAIEKDSHRRLINLCKRVFGQFNAKTKWGHKTYVTRFPSVTNTPLSLSGVPRGDKRLFNCYAPKDILKREEFMKAYLRKAFDDEGGIVNNTKKRVIRLSRSVDVTHLNLDIGANRPQIWAPYKLPLDVKHNLLEGEKIMLEKLGVRAKVYLQGIYKSKNNRITAKWTLVIQQQDNLRKFSELINFNLIHKQNKLKKTLNSYRVHKLSNGEGNRRAYEFLMKVYKEKGIFRFGDLGRELVKTGRTYDLAGRYLKNLMKKGLIKKITPTRRSELSAP